jgi:hypothetical protein
MNNYELCINQTTPGGGERYATLDDATLAAEGETLLDPDVYVTIHEYTGDSSTIVYDSRWPVDSGDG